MSRSLRIDWAIAALGAIASSASAAESDSILTLGEVAVTAAATGELATQSVFTSVDRMGADLIENQSVDSAWELFGHMPGVQITEFNQGTTSGKFSFRAFNGEGEINAVKLLIDGIPSNTNDGNMPFIDMVMPLDIEYIETVKGTNDPRYGLYNIAGNASIVTRTSGNYEKMRLSTGSFGTQDAQAALGGRRPLLPALLCGLAPHRWVSRPFGPGQAELRRQMVPEPGRWRGAPHRPDPARLQRGCPGAGLSHPP